MAFSLVLRGSALGAEQSQTPGCEIRLELSAKLAWLGTRHGQAQSDKGRDRYMRIAEHLIHPYP